MARLKPCLKRNKFAQLALLKLPSSFELGSRNLR
jgi:hypothetical protein